MRFSHLRFLCCFPVFPIPELRRAAPDEDPPEHLLHIMFPVRNAMMPTWAASCEQDRPARLSPWGVLGDVVLIKADDDPADRMSFHGVFLSVAAGVRWWGESTEPLPLFSAPPTPPL
jgi:hypothetical protein